MVKFCSSCGKRLSFFEGLPPGSCICTDCKKKNVAEEKRIEPEKGVEKERKKIAEVIEEIKITQGNEQIIGIDLGTSNSQAAVLQGGQFTIIPSSEGITVAGKMCPSVIAFTKNGQVLVGEPARRQAITNPEGTMASVKRKLGTNHKYKVHDTEYAPQQISAFILKKIKRDAEAFLGKEVKKAVITVPSSFNDNQRTATKDAGRIAGFEVVRLVNESTAAAMAYSLFDSNSQKIMVFDLGGGKLDVTLMDIGGGVFTVLTTAGDTQIGGNDMDAVIVDWIIKEFKKREGIDLSTDRMVTERLREAAEKAKIELSTVPETEINLPYISADMRGQKHLSQKVTRGQLEQLVDPIIKRCISPIEQALKDAHLSKQDINKVILVGGPTRMPIVEESIKRYMGIPKVERRADPMEYVAIGGAIQGSILAGAITNRVLLDVYSHTLGIETLGKVMTPLIERNTSIPTKKSQIFSTTRDSQTTVTIHVLQGDRSMAPDNISLGMFNLVEIPPAPRGKPQIEVTFDIDASGIIRVSAKDLGTGREQKMTVTASTKLSEGEIERMMNEAKKFDKKLEEKVPPIVNNYSNLDSDMLRSRDSSRLHSNNMSRDEIIQFREGRERFVCEVSKGDEDSAAFNGKYIFLLWLRVAWQEFANADTATRQFVQLQRSGKLPIWFQTEEIKGKFSRGEYEVEMFKDCPGCLIVLYLSDPKKATDLNSFLNSIAQRERIDYRFQRKEFINIYNALSEMFKSKGYPSSQITDLLRSNLYGTCPDCHRFIKGADLGDLWIAEHMGSKNVIYSGSDKGFNRLVKGSCPNEKCPSKEIVLSWRP